MARHQVPDLQDRIEYALFSGLLAVLSWPSLSLSRAWGRALGSLVAWVLPLRKRVALENISGVFPEKSERECLEVYHGMCRTFGITLADFARFRRKHRDETDDVILVGGINAIQSALMGGRGAMLMSAHFGNWEVMGITVAGLGVPITALGARQRNPLVEAAINRLRARRGMPSIAVGRSLKPILRALGQGQCVATLADQDGGRDGFFMEFLGREASVQSGLFRLAARKRIPIVTGHSLWNGRRWVSFFDPPEWPRKVSGPEGVEAEARRLAELYTRRVEAWVRQHPDHWFWVHRRWKTRPSDKR